MSARLCEQRGRTLEKPVKLDETQRLAGPIYPAYKRVLIVHVLYSPPGDREIVVDSRYLTHAEPDAKVPLLEQQDVPVTQARPLTEGRTAVQYDERLPANVEDSTDAERHERNQSRLLVPHDLRDR